MRYDYLHVLSDPSSDLEKILYMLASGVPLCGTYGFLTWIAEKATVQIVVAAL